MSTVAAKINALARRRNEALERGGIDLWAQIGVLEIQNELFNQVREQRDKLDDILWRWFNGKLDS